MKTISLLMISAFLFSFGIGVLAQETELPDPGLTPDSPFYFLETVAEGIGTFFSFGDLKKAERYATLAAERVAEAQAVVEKGKPEFAEKTLARYENQLNNSIARAEKAQAKGQSIKNVMEIVAEGTGKHLTVIENILEKVSEKAKEAATKAKEASLAGQKNALRVLAGEDPERATEINLKAAEARLNRAKVKAEKGDAEDAQEAIGEFENQYKFGEEISQIAQGVGKDITTVEQLVGKATSVHLEVLVEVYEKAPEQAKPAIGTLIENAMKVSLKGHEKTVESLKAKDALGEVPEEVSLPSQIPQEARERIQTEIQQELEIEKILEGIDSSKSLKDICAEKGGTPEMCEQFPLEKFESFEQVEAFCTEKGGPPEICASIEAKCREFGVTTANECFLLLSIASIKTYQSVTIEAVPAPSLSEEEMKERIKIEEKIRRMKPPIEEETVKMPPEELECKFKEMIFYYSDICTPCERVKNEGTLSKIEGLGVKVTQIDVKEGPVEYDFSGVPAFIIDKKVYAGYKTFEQVKDLLGCQ